MTALDFVQRLIGLGYFDLPHDLGIDKRAALNTIEHARENDSRPWRPRQ